MLVTKNVRFYGTVQGVNFRRNTSVRARALGLTGWVMNLPDGSVEAEFSGEESSVDDVIDYCINHMSAATVTRHEIKNEEYREFPDFTIRR